MKRSVLLAVVGCLFAGRAEARPEAGAVLGSIPIPVSVLTPRGLTYDGAQFWIADGDALVAVDTQGQLVTTIATAAGRSLTKLTYDGAHLWALEARTSIEALDSAGNPLLALSSTWSSGIAFDPIRQLVWDLEESNGGTGSKLLFERSVSGGAPAAVTTDETHQGWSGLAFDGCSLWAYDPAAPRFVRFDPATGATLATYDFGSATGTDLAFYGPYAIAVLDPDLRQITLVEAGSIDIGTSRCVPSLSFPSPPSIDAGVPEQMDAASAPDAVSADAAVPAADAGIPLPPPDAGHDGDSGAPTAEDASVPPDEPAPDNPPPELEGAGEDEPSGCDAVGNDPSFGALGALMLLSAWSLGRRRSRRRRRRRTAR